MSWKFGPFLDHYDSVVRVVKDKLLANNFSPGTDMIVMTLNDGELDLFLNYACSCVFHNISLEHVIVFSGSPEVVKIIESTGAMGVAGILHFFPSYE